MIDGYASRRPKTQPLSERHSSICGRSVRQISGYLAVLGAVRSHFRGDKCLSTNPPVLQNYLAADERVTNAYTLRLILRIHPAPREMENPLMGWQRAT